MNASIRDTFFEECEDLLEALSEGLNHLNPDHLDLDVVNAVFRAVHSIKGGAGAFGLDDLVGFSHTFETVLDQLRSEKLDLNQNLMDVFFAAGDQLSDLVSAARDGLDIDQTPVTNVLTELNTYLEDDAHLAPAQDLDFSFDAISLDLDSDPVELDTMMPSIASGTNVFEIRFKPYNSLFANGHEPALLFEAVAQLGELEVQLHDANLPEFEDLDTADFGLEWHLVLETSESELALDPIFEFVEGLCDLKITCANTVQNDIPPVEIEDEPDISAVEILDTPIPETPVTKSSPRAVTAPKPTLRVDLERVDKLINTVGELIINQAMIAQQIEKLELPNGSYLSNELEGYKLLAREIQEGVMAIRAQPVKPLFQRMARIVREAAQDTGKKAKLVTIGEDTEVDKTVVERLADPLTHMVRNAIDHGLEGLDERLQKGKPEIGAITLTASHRSGSVVIEISDDGAGLNRDKIKEIAISKGLISSNAELSDAEIDNLLFLPGFSTVSKVSNLSGRGVGMDVVKNAVSALGGRISIESNPGKGTVFTVILPLTLAVLDGMVVSVADQTMVVPITSILETVRPLPSDLHQLGKDNFVLAIRGTYIPIVGVAQRLNLNVPPPNTVPEVLLVVETEDHGTRALAIDAIHDQRQVVIKSLEGNYGKIPGVSAATILGDGQIALILDPESIADMHPVPHPLEEATHVA